MPSPITLFWKQAPFIRFLLPLIAGILIQWYYQCSVILWWAVLTAASTCLIIFFSIPLFRRYKFSWLNGIAVFLTFSSIGALLIWVNDTRNHTNWFGHFHTEKTSLVITLDEPLVEKAKSFKAEATTNYIIQGERKLTVRGKIIVYFQKDSALPAISYGSRIILTRPLQEIKNSGNPGSFDYKRYSLFHGITHQVYLEQGEFSVLDKNHSTLFQRILYTAEESVLTILRDNIAERKALGLAEALLIGYKDDLDKTLVQSYSNTGVVHVIAISGLHIGLIYWLLDLLFKPLAKRKKFRWIRFILVSAGLWGFSLLAGGQPSVLRSAVMFTCIVLGQSFARHTSIYNTLAFSAFLLLCYNPYWLWDVGFQLSYSAVLSIIIFMKPIYNWFYIKNKLLDFVWKLNAVTLAAQILTLPFTIYYFHQFPVLFFLSNLVAVPLSSLIVLGEILLCIISFIPDAALFTGKLIGWSIGLMNNYIELIEHLPASLWEGLQIDIWQTVLLFGVITGIGFWTVEKLKYGLLFALFCLLGFAISRTHSFILTKKQQRLIIYNVPKYRAIDIIGGRSCLFTGDSILLEDEFAFHFHLEPSRVLHRVTPVSTLPGYLADSCYAVYCGKKILLLDTTRSFRKIHERPIIDLAIISGNPRLYIDKLANTFDIKQVVFDGSAARRKLFYWKKDCDSLHIPWHDVSEKGAFVMSFN